jgi:hypothetical protein
MTGKRIEVEVSRRGRDVYAKRGGHTVARARSRQDLLRQVREAAAFEQEIKLAKQTQQPQWLSMASAFAKTWGPQGMLSQEAVAAFKKANDDWMNDSLAIEQAGASRNAVQIRQAQRKFALDMQGAQELIKGALQSIMADDIYHSDEVRQAAGALLEQMGGAGNMQPPGATGEPAPLPTTLPGVKAAGATMRKDGDGGAAGANGDDNEGGEATVSMEQGLVPHDPMAPGRRHLTRPMAEADALTKEELSRVGALMKHNFTAQELAEAEDIRKKGRKWHKTPKFERCVNDVKAQGREIGSAFAVCHHALDPQSEVAAAVMDELHKVELADAFIGNYGRDFRRVPYKAGDWRPADVEPDDITDWAHFLPISKRGEEQRLVEGFASSSRWDTQDDIVDPAGFKRALPDFMKWANLREMHENIASGTVLTCEPVIADITLIDGSILKYDAKSRSVTLPDGDEIVDPVHIIAHVEDDGTWAKVKKKILKGFSIGGKAVDWVMEQVAGADKLVRRITDLLLTEISLVDRPANPDARVLVFKRYQSDAEVAEACVGAFCPDRHVTKATNDWDFRQSDHNYWHRKWTDSGIRATIQQNGSEFVTWGADMQTGNLLFKQKFSSLKAAVEFAEGKANAAGTRGTNWSGVKRAVEAVSRKFNGDMFRTEVEGDEFVAEFRYGEGLFRARRNEEDDDHPIFVGEDKLIAAVDSEMRSAGLAGKFSYEISPEEKWWVRIYFKPRVAKLTKAGLGLDNEGDTVDIDSAAAFYAFTDHTPLINDPNFATVVQTLANSDVARRNKDESAVVSLHMQRKGEQAIATFTTMDLPLTLYIPTQAAKTVQNPEEGQAEPESIKDVLAARQAGQADMQGAQLAYAAQAFLMKAMEDNGLVVWIDKRGTKLTDAQLKQAQSAMDDLLENTDFMRDYRKKRMTYSQALTELADWALNALQEDEDGNVVNRVVPEGQEAIVIAQLKPLAEETLSMFTESAKASLRKDHRIAGDKPDADIEELNGERRVVVVGRDLLTQYPVLYRDGRVGWDRPEQVPMMVKTKAGRLLRQLKAEEGEEKVAKLDFASKLNGKRIYVHASGFQPAEPNVGVSGGFEEITAEDEDGNAVKLDRDDIRRLHGEAITAARAEKVAGPSVHDVVELHRGGATHGEIMKAFRKDWASEASDAALRNYDKAIQFPTPQAASAALNIPAEQLGAEPAATQPAPEASDQNIVSALTGWVSKNPQIAALLGATVGEGGPPAWVIAAGVAMLVAELGLDAKIYQMTAPARKQFMDFLGGKVSQVLGQEEKAPQGPQAQPSAPSESAPGPGPTSPGVVAAASDDLRKDEISSLKKQLEEAIRGKKFGRAEDAGGRIMDAIEAGAGSDIDKRLAPRVWREILAMASYFDQQENTAGSSPSTAMPEYIDALWKRAEAQMRLWNSPYQKLEKSRASAEAEMRKVANPVYDRLDQFIQQHSGALPGGFTADAVKVARSGDAAATIAFLEQNIPNSSDRDMVRDFSQLLQDLDGLAAGAQAQAQAAPAELETEGPQAEAEAPDEEAVEPAEPAGENTAEEGPAERRGKPFPPKMARGRLRKQGPDEAPFAALHGQPAPANPYAAQGEPSPLEQTGQFISNWMNGLPNFVANWMDQHRGSLPRNGWPDTNWFQQNVAALEKDYNTSMTSNNALTGGPLVAQFLQAVRNKVGNTTQVIAQEVTKWLRQNLAQLQAGGGQGLPRQNFLQQIGTNLVGQGPAKAAGGPLFKAWGGGYGGKGGYGEMLAQAAAAEDGNRVHGIIDEMSHQPGGKFGRFVTKLMNLLFRGDFGRIEEMANEIEAQEKAERPTLRKGGYGQMLLDAASAEDEKKVGGVIEQMAHAPGGRFKSWIKKLTGLMFRGDFKAISNIAYEIERTDKVAKQEEEAAEAAGEAAKVGAKAAAAAVAALKDPKKMREISRAMRLLPAAFKNMVPNVEAAIKRGDFVGAARALSPIVQYSPEIAAVIGKEVPEAVGIFGGVAAAALGGKTHDIEDAAGDDMGKAEARFGAAYDKAVKKFEPRGTKNLRGSRIGPRAGVDYGVPDEFKPEAEKPEDSVISLDIDTVEPNELKLPEGVTSEVIEESGPGGGWPIVRLKGPAHLVRGILNDQYNMVDEDIDSIYGEEFGVKKEGYVGGRTVVSGPQGPTAKVAKATVKPMALFDNGLPPDLVSNLRKALVGLSEVKGGEKFADVAEAFSYLDRSFDLDTNPGLEVFLAAKAKDGSAIEKADAVPGAPAPGVPAPNAPPAPGGIGAAAVALGEEAKVSDAEVIHNVIRTLAQILTDKGDAMGQEVLSLYANSTAVVAGAGAQQPASEASGGTLGGAATGGAAGGGGGVQGAAGGGAGPVA